MAKKPVPSPAPVTFDLPESLILKLEAQRKKLGLKSISETVRHAIDNFDLSTYENQTEVRRQISVRLPSAQKTTLVKAARKQKISLGEIVRASVESLSAKRAKR